MFSTLVGQIRGPGFESWTPVVGPIILLLTKLQNIA